MLLHLTYLGLGFFAGLTLMSLRAAFEARELAREALRTVLDRMRDIRARDPGVTVAELLDEGESVLRKMDRDARGDG
ncbi:MAG TPA: hypothetical protein VIJ33_07735 [Solirubrobacteraceae bacterium]